VDLAHGHVLPDADREKEVIEMAEEEIGKVTHYFSKAQVAAIEITAGTLRVGDTIHIKGHTSDFTQTVDSMQIEHESVQEATPGQAVGIKVVEHARVHDTVYKVTD
jgi:putative protease